MQNQVNIIDYLVYIIWKGEFCLLNSLNLQSYKEYVSKKTPFFERNNKNYESKARRLFSEETYKILTFFTNKDLIGETDIMKVDGLSRKFTMKATKDSVVIELNKNDLKCLYNLDPEFKEKIEVSRNIKESVIKYILENKQTVSINLIKYFNSFLDKRVQIQETMQIG